jgi:hypothetical protein
VSGLHPFASFGVYLTPDLIQLLLFVAVAPIATELPAKPQARSNPIALRITRLLRIVAMTSPLGLATTTNAVMPGLPLSADVLRLNGPSDSGSNIQEKSLNLFTHNISVIPSSLLALLLQYLLPPSPAGLPPHLLSRALSSRHRYLNIEPSEDLGAYYALSSASAPAVQVLEDIGAYHRAEDGFDSIIGQIRYVAECGYDVDGTVGVKSFVQLRCEAREVSVVLIWEGEWKFTDVRLGPLPAGLCPTPALAINSTRSSGRVKAPANATRVVIQAQSTSDLDEEEDGGDDYWARYGANSDSEDEESGVPRNSLMPFQKKEKGKRKAHSSGSRSVNEDAYWAQYGTGSVIASPEAGNRATLMAIQQQHDAIMGGEEDSDKELRAAVKEALACSPSKPQPNAPKPKILNLDLTTPTVHPFPTSFDQVQPDTGTSLIFPSDANQGPNDHSVPYPLPHSPTTHHRTLDAITNEPSISHRHPPLQSTSGVARGLALDLNTPPPTDATLSITSMLPAMASPTSTVVPAFPAAGSGPTTETSPLLVGVGSPVVGAAERGLGTGVRAHATGGSTAGAGHKCGGPANLIGVLIREQPPTVTANHTNRVDGKPTRPRVEDTAGFEGDEAVLQSVRGMFRMWRILRGTTHGNSTAGDNDVVSAARGGDNTNEVEEKREFLSLVVRAMADL